MFDTVLCRRLCYTRVLVFQHSLGQLERNTLSQSPFFQWAEEVKVKTWSEEFNFKMPCWFHIRFRDEFCRWLCTGFTLAQMYTTLPSAMVGLVHNAASFMFGLTHVCAWHVIQCTENILFFKSKIIMIDNFCPPDKPSSLYKKNKKNMKNQQ